jgi:spermidine/putrescine transport system ATP-binding protein
MDNVLRLEKLNKSFRGVQAVKDLSLDLRAGEFVTLLGPSGCGKSTTLRMIGGFETPDSGRIYIDGVDSTMAPPNKRNVNMVFQDYALFPHLNVEKNVGFGLQLKGWSAPAIKARVAELLKLVQLDQYAERAPHQLSGGQRQRVALARALAPDPPVLLLDEPLGALDARLRRDMQIELRALQRTTGKTFVLVTHDQEEALTMSDTIVVMNQGVIEQIGTPSDLYNRPQTEFVARFVGEMNFKEAEVTRHEGEIVELMWAGSLIKALSGGLTHDVGARRLAAVRPEDIRIAAEPDHTRNAVRGRVVERIFRGSEVRYVVMVNGKRVDVAARQHELPDGVEEVWLIWDSSRTLLLN